MKKTIQRVAGAIFLGFGIGFNSFVSATTIVLNNLDGPNEGFNDQSSPFANQTNNNGMTLGEQRLNVFRAAADFWEQRIDSDVPIIVDINMDPLFCTAFSATLGSAGPENAFVNFSNAPVNNRLFVSAVANSLSGQDLDPSTSDIGATFNSAIDNNDNCLGGTNWWLGIDSSAPVGTISLFDTVLHEIGHGLGVVSFVSLSDIVIDGQVIVEAGAFLADIPDAFSANLFDSQTNQSWLSMTNSERLASSINSGNLVWEGENATVNTGHLSLDSRTNGSIRMFAPDPVQPGSSVSHWDTVLSPDELMEPFATDTSDERATLQLLRDVGWRLLDTAPPIVPTSEPPEPEEDDGFLLNLVPSIIRAIPDQ